MLKFIKQGCTMYSLQIKCKHKIFEVLMGVDFY